MYAFRGEASIPFESSLERDFLVRKEFSLDVADVIAQPCQIPFFDPKTRRSYLYTPDYLVYYRLGNRHYEDYPKPLLVEVKPATEWRKHWRRWLPKWKAAWRYAKEQGCTFRIHDETRIRDQAFQNIVFLERYKRMQFAPEDSAAVLETVQQMGCATMDYLLARHFMGIYRAQGIAHIWHLLAMRLLECDISQPFGEFTEFWMPSDE